MIARLAVRNLSRNAWRSALTIGGVAVAVALLIWMMAFLNGWMDAMVRGITGIDTLQVKVERQDYVDDPAIYHSFPLDPALLSKLEARPEVLAATGRIKLYGLIGNEERSQVAQIVGVDPAREAAATPLATAITKGNWLKTEARHANDDDAPSPGEVVLGEGLARQLKVDIGDELVVFLEAADGSLGNELFAVSGILKTGNSAVDRQAAYIHLEDAQFLAALEGQVHEIALQTADPGRARHVAALIASSVEGMGPEAPLSVRPWNEIVPQISEMVDLSQGSTVFMYFIIYLVASLGVMNAQRMSALERRREFAVMMAIGVTPNKLFRVIVAETVVLGLFGALLGGVLGLGFAYYHSTVGIDLAMFSDQTTFSYLGVSFSDRLYTTFSFADAVEPILVMLGVALVCGIWPAVQGARITITAALSGRS